MWSDCGRAQCHTAAAAAAAAAADVACGIVPRETNNQSHNPARNVVALEHEVCEMSAKKQ